MTERLALKSFRLKNFKSVRDSGEVEFTPLTVFIGNNGAGKSSLIEGLETFQTLVDQGLDAAMNRWRGYENIRNRGVVRQLETDDEQIPEDEDDIYQETDYVSEFGYADEDEEADDAEERRKELNPIEFYFSREVSDGLMEHTTVVNSSPNGDELFIESEELSINGNPWMARYERGDAQLFVDSQEVFSLSDGDSIISTLRPRHQQARTFANAVLLWQFALLNPDAMVHPIPRTRTGKVVHLARDGSNIAEYLLDIRKMDQDAFDEIIETLQYVLPYASDLQPSLASELERTVYLQLSEQDYKLPGWLLSTGTLRILALLSLLRHPNPPPLIVIEEIENGLDPRTINLIVDELRDATESGLTQVIVTTHSPYLLDLVDLEQIVVVERENGEPTFFRPADNESLQEWTKSFTPGKLYTMSQLKRRRD